MERFASHCVFPAPDIQRTARCCRDALGFRRMDHLDASEPHVCLYRDDAAFILSDSRGRRVIPNRDLTGYGGDACVFVRDQQALQNECEAKHVNIVQRLHRTDYHNREFVIEDIDGRWICFGIRE